MTIEHKDIPEIDLHEPKGVSTAVANQIYIADGVGGGAWSASALPGSPGQQYGKTITADGTGNSAFNQKVWKDLIGVPTTEVSGPTAPSFTAFNGVIQAHAFSVSDETQIWYHMPHDYALGTDVFLHAHWSHNGATSIAGSIVWTYSACSAKSHNQQNFSTPAVSGTITTSTPDIATIPRYFNALEEIQLSSATPTASQLDTATLEPDSIVAINCSLTTIPTIVGGSPNEPFLLFVDLHYQSDMEGTLNKTPNFYA